MLLRFSVENFLSMATKQEISLVASKLTGPEEALVEVPSTAGHKALSAALIYGANASGKSNFINALNWMVDVIVHSHRGGDPQGGVARYPFALNKEIAKEPTSVEADFLADGVRYVYGFECNDDRFIAEWLYAFPEGKRRKLFERDLDDVAFGTHLKGSKRALVEFMRPNSLFLSTATQNSHEDLTRIASFFGSFVFSDNVSVSEHTINHSFKKNEIDRRTISFLAAIGTGIVSFRLKDKILSESIKQFNKELMDLVRKNIEVAGVPFPERLEKDKDVEVELAHTANDGTLEYFSLERESAGTRRLLIVMSAVYSALDNGTVVVIDELDASLHTYAAEMILKLFHDPAVNRKGAQLIATTHDTNILNSKCLRRDQIWFSEKNSSGESELFSLAEIKSRPNDDFEQGYLEGRYGAIPFAGSSQYLVGEREG